MNEEQLKEIASQLRRPEGENGLKTAEMMNVGNLQLNRDTLRVLSAENGENLLEVGMGNGRFVKDILVNKPLLTYTGCDFSTQMVEAAKKINADWINKNQVKFIEANVNSLPFGDNFFDKAFTVNTIYFWDDAPIALSELKRVLKPNGALILGLRPKHEMVNYPFTKYGFKMYSKEDVTDLLETNGFKLIKVFENPEPDFELHGEVMKMENLVVLANKK